MPGEPKNQPPFTRTARAKPKPKPKPKPRPTPKPAVDHAAARRASVIAVSRSLVGIRETPAHSNDGPAVRVIQSATGAYRAPWCVSTLQREDVLVLGSTYANRTAGAYYYAEYARELGHLIAKPLPGCAVIYYIGNGHAGRVVTVHADGSFDAVEGNENDGVHIVPRNPRYITCRFVLRPEYRSAGR